MDIYCCKCQEEVDARLTDGLEIYPHRPDLKKLPFWKCDACGNYVGCHHKTKKRTQPLGVIPSPKIRQLRTVIHANMDPLWKKYGYKRNHIYSAVSNKIGYSFHTSELRTVKDCLTVLSIIESFYNEMEASGDIKLRRT